MGNSANLSVDVVANTRQAQREIEGFSSKTAGLFAGLAASVSSFAIDKVAQGATWAASELVDAVGNAASLNAALQTTQQLYGDAAGEIERWAGAAAKSLGLSKVKALETARTFSVYGKQIGLTGTELAAFSESLAQTAADLGAFNDVPTAEAVQMIGSAFRGERDPIERLGIVLNDATVKAAYFAATGEKVTGVLTPQQNIIGTLAALNQQAADATGQYARESGNLQGQQQETSATWENMSAALGEKLLPAVTALATWVNEKLLPALRDLGTWWDTSPVAQKVKDLASAISDKLQQAADDLVKWWNEPGGGRETFDGFVAAMESLEPKLRDAYNGLRDLKNMADQALQSVGGLSGLMKMQFAATLLNIYMISNALLTVWNAIVWTIKSQVVVWMLLWQQLQKVAEWLGSVVELAETFIGIGGGGLLGGIGGLFAAPTRGGRGGPATYGSGYTYAPTFVVNTSVPLGVHAGDVGAAILEQLQALERRTGPLPLRVVPGGA